MREWTIGEKREQRSQEEVVGKEELKEAVGPRIQIMMMRIDEGEEDEEE